MKPSKSHVVLSGKDSAGEPAVAAAVKLTQLPIEF
jgi:hypothetical protein